MNRCDINVVFRTFVLAAALPIALGACGAISDLLGGSPDPEGAKIANAHMRPSSPPAAATKADDAGDTKPPPKVAASSGKKGFKATCKKNSECESDICWVGSGAIGYCTTMCDDSFDCSESFWECRQPGNAAQRICVQPK